MFRTLRIPLLAGLAVLAAQVATAATPTVRLDFNRDIRPILSDNCYACHGPDEAGRKAKLRLDRRPDALAVLKSGAAAVVPGKPQESSLIKRVVTQDADDLMPPAKTGKKLTPAQIDKLRQWITDGADWPEHWAYTPAQRKAPPAVENRRWVRNPIDQFVLAKLEKDGLEPSPEADDATLIRRASLDLTGLPPTVEEVDAYLADTRPDKYEQLADRLLASPRYGEHMARYWMDSVRYADAHGYHIDSQRDIWAYREWVVNAFNANKRFDEFTTEQLAGDLLPNPSTAQKVATGFVRCNMSTGEGGIIEAEYAAKYAFDRTETLGTVWLGLTLVCARCHTHKYDPIAQREYYGLYAIFNQLDEPVMDGNRPNPDPFLKLPSPEQSSRLEWLQDHLRTGQAKVDGPAPALDQAQTGWMQQWHEKLASAWTLVAPESARSLATNAATLQVQADRSVLASGTRPETDRYELTLAPAPGRVSAIRLEALPDPNLPGQASGRADDGRFQLSEFEIELVPAADGPEKGAPRKLKIRTALADAADAEQSVDRAIDGRADTGWGLTPAAGRQPHQALFVLDEPVGVTVGAKLRLRLAFEAAKSGRSLGHFRLALGQGDDLARLLNPPRFEPWKLVGPLPSPGLAAGLAQVYPPETQLDLKATFAGVREEARWHDRGDLADGATHTLVDELHGVHGTFFLHRTIQAPEAVEAEFSLRADDVFKVWLNGKPVAERTDPEKDRGLSTKFRVNLAAGENRLLVKIVNHQGSKRFSFGKEIGDGDALTPEVATILASVAAPEGDWAPRVRDLYRRRHSEEFRNLFDDMARWREEQGAIEAAIPTTLVAKELAKPRDTFLLSRGEYDKPADRVAPGVPSILPAWPAGAPTNRLGLARWLLDPAHPLTARVIVNRYWQAMFGTGLVKTSDDFGVQGDRPSHPDLLDWLATEFVQSGWNVKHLERLMVTSATYRQASAVTPALLARDPENRLLARGPRFRADAEVVRDSLLFIGGLLADQTGGRSAKPFEPPGLWEAVSYNNAQKYVQDRGTGNYRRSLYTHWKRQSPPPNMLIFDAPTREYCVVRRPRTNTPLQALALLNDPQFVEASRSLAQRMVLQGGTDPVDRLRYGFRLATGRRPDADEVRILRGLLDAQLAEFRTQPDAAAQFLSPGEFKTRAGLDPIELAAWTSVANLLLNLDETVTKG